MPTHSAYADVTSLGRVSDDVVGARTQVEKFGLLHALGADAVPMNARPDAVVDEMTALAEQRRSEALRLDVRAHEPPADRGNAALLAAAAAADVERFVVQSYIGWNAGGATEEDPLVDDPVPAQRQTLAAIRELESLVPDGIVLRYGRLYGPGASEQLVELVSGGCSGRAGAPASSTGLRKRRRSPPDGRAPPAALLDRVPAARQRRRRRGRRAGGAEQQDGDVDELVGMLAADAVVGDGGGGGGGEASQWGTPIVGPERIAKLLAGTGMQMRKYGMRLELRRVNGPPGAVLRMANGDVAVVWTVEIADGAVQALRSVINPDRLRHLGPVADRRALLRAERGR